jgi:hypothetical protein
VTTVDTSGALPAPPDVAPTGAPRRPGPVTYADGSRNAAEWELTIDSLFHLVGMVGAGKSTIMHLLTYHCVVELGLKVTIVVGDETVEQLSAGSWLAKPRHVPHAMWNVGQEPARILEVVLPGGIEQYFEQLAPILKEHGPEWTQRYAALAEEFGLTILDDWTEELTRKYGITL